ncbi:MULTISPECIES: helix-turn-helix transcriptional regulator [unclassified Lonepinella]|uniref:helix-turn-helix transcriptional regulator n=1 Tax=unclassified Lonepinella TaxID=2642006 RepID=UPI0036DA668E
MTDETITLSVYATAKEICKLLHLSRAKLYTMANAGEFPPPLKLGRALRWRVSTVKNWLDQQEQTTQGGN